MTSSRYSKCLQKKTQHMKIILWKNQEVLGLTGEFLKDIVPPSAGLFLPSQQQGHFKSNLEILAIKLFVKLYFLIRIY